MIMGKKNFLNKKTSKQNAAIFMSGGGTNVEKLFEYIFAQKIKRWLPSVIITDAPKTSKASDIAFKFNIPITEHDIKQFYRKKGEKRVSLITETGRKIRQEWTNKLREMLSCFQIDFGILAGFIPLTNIMEDFPCLNVHPGDLTIERNGRRLLVGLHTLPIETAIINGIRELRASVVLVQKYTGRGNEMDTGPILGISAPIPIDFMGISLFKLKATAQKRPPQRPIGGYGDILENVAKHNQERLKRQGDWIVLPRVVDDFASNKFALDGHNNLYFKPNRSWVAIKTVVYNKKTSFIEKNH